jgi:hypothetical protein
MSENEEPDPSDELRKGSEHLAGQIGPLMRQMAPYLQAQEALRRQMEPMMQAHERWRRQFEPMLQAHERLRRQMEPILRAQEAYRRQIEPIARAVEQFARIANWPKINIGPAPPYPLRLATAVDAGMHQRLPGYAQGGHTVAVAGTATATGSAPTPQASIAGQMPVKRSQRGMAALSDGEIAALVLVWLYALVLPWFASALPPEFHAMLTDGYATFAIALAITWRLLDKKQ